MRTKKGLCFAIIVALFLSLVTTLYAATPDFDFYKGKTITYIVATKPGGGYDVYGRLISKYLQKYIPGSLVIVKNVAGAGHIIGANETYMAKPDGRTIGTYNTGLIYAQLVGLQGIRFDLAKYRYIGKANSEHRVLLVSINSPYKSIKDLIESKEPIKMASSGVGTAAYNETIIVAAGLGANLKPIPGYSGREGEMGMMRGEVTGTIGSYAGLIGFIKAKECRILLQIANRKHKDMPDVPLAKELNLSDKGRKFMAIVAGNGDLGRLTAAPPNTQPGRLEALREAYKKALNDPALLKDAEKMMVDIDPAFGDEVEEMMKEVMHQPEENVTMLRSVIKVEQ